MENPHPIRFLAENQASQPSPPNLNGDPNSHRSRCQNEIEWNRLIQIAAEVQDWRLSRSLSASIAGGAVGQDGSVRNLSCAGPEDSMNLLVESARPKDF